MQQLMVDHRELVRLTFAGIVCSQCGEPVKDSARAFVLVDEGLGELLGEESEAANSLESLKSLLQKHSLLYCPDCMIREEVRYTCFFIRRQWWYVGGLFIPLPRLVYGMSFRRLLN